MTNLDSNGPTKQRLAWNQIVTLYRYELRSALRERAIVINSILIPIFLYPLIMWVAFSGIMLVKWHSDSTQSRVVVQDWPREHPELRNRITREKRITLIEETNRFDPREISAARLDALVLFEPASGSASNLPGNFQVGITFDSSKDRSVAARERLESVINDYRREWLAREARKREISPEEWAGIHIDSKNVATKRQMGGFVLGMMLPILFVVMVAAGTFYPAIDCTAGERERNTWETLMSSGASRVNVIVAKYLYVTTFGTMAGILNLLAFAVTLKPIFAPLLKEAGTMLNFTVLPQSIPLIATGAVLLAGFVSAGMMIFAAFARTFKEGQAMIMPFYLIVMLPPIFLQTPGIQFSVPLSCVPVVNVTMMIRSALTGEFPMLQIAITFVASVLAIALCIRIAAYILKFEEVMIGNYNGSLKRFLRERFLAKPGRSMKGAHD